jgi:two-component system sensor histidine kinase/response regulator
MMSANPRVLVIDDEPNIRDGCKNILEGEGWETDVCGDGEEGILMIKRGTYALALVDLKMPGVGGIDVMHTIRGFDPSILIVVITGYTTVESAVEAMKQGAYDFIAKPFSADQLVIVVRRALEKRDYERRAETLRQQLDRLKMDFVAMVSHELRSPLASVTQQLLALEKVESITRGKPLLDGALTTLEDLRGLVEDLLELSRIEAGRIIEDKVKTDIGQIIVEAAGMLSTKAQHNGVQLVIELPAGSLVAPVDPKCLRRVVDNLIDNAIKYSRKGGKVRVTGQCRPREIELCVEDAGIGISPEHLPLIFERFYRVRDLKTRGIGGSGLGLSIVKGIIEAHNGKVEVDSQVDKGSRFRIFLPA